MNLLYVDLFCGAVYMTWRRPRTCGCFPNAGPVPRTGIFPKPKAEPLPTLGFIGLKTTVETALLNGYELQPPTDAFLIWHVNQHL